MPEIIIIADSGKAIFRLSAVVLIREVEGKYVVSLNNGIEVSIADAEAKQLITHLLTQHPSVKLL